jgi:uncharacterized protein DUF3105
MDARQPRHASAAVRERTAAFKTLRGGAPAGEAMRTDAHTWSARHGGPPRPLLRYALTWLGACAVIVAVVALIHRDSHPVTLPPVGQIRLERAAHAARCDLRRGRAAERVNPPGDGTPGRAAAPGTYKRPLPAPALAAAMRHGIVVIQYRPGLSARLVDVLTALQSAVPKGTIVAPNATRMPYEVAATAWRRVLGCPRLDDTTIDAVRLFRGRFVGSTPGG